MKILIVTDKEKSAIWRMADGVKKYLPHMHIDIIAVHPKRPDIDQLNRFQELVIKADILQFEYWKTYVKLRDMYSELLKKPKILAHHNPYNLMEESWEEFDKIIAYNKSMHQKLERNKKAIHFQHTIDVEKFPFNDDYDLNSKKVIMVSSRIESKKGVLPVAQICQKLGYKFILVGSISDGEYFKKIMENDCVEFRENISDEELLKSYHEASVCVVNSIDNYESGPLILLEAMSTGCPVLTREVGEVCELNNGKNMVVRKGQPENLKDLEKELKSLMNNKVKRKQIREDAWQTAKTRDDVRRARDYEKLWYSVLYKEPVVSLIIPTFNRKKTLLDVIKSVVEQTYPAIEIVIADDGSSDGTRKMIKYIREKTDYPIKYINTNTPDEYNLGLARNLGSIEAIGEILLFMDDRYKLKNDCVARFVENLFPKMFLYGNKGAGKRDFVENFSCIYRKEFMTAGMFNSNIKFYGFLTQETRERFLRQGYKYKYIEEAECETILGSKARWRKKEEIRKAKNILYKMNF